MSVFQQSVADLKQQNGSKVEQGGSDQRRPAAGTGTEEVLEGSVELCTIGAGSMDDPEAGKGQADDEVKQSADQYHNGLAI